MFKESVSDMCELINENFAMNAGLDGFIVGLGGPALEFAKAAWQVSMILAAVVFAIVACYELYAQSVRTEGHGGAMGGTEVVFKVMFKVAVCYIVLQVSFDLLVGVFGTSNSLTEAFGGATTSLYDGDWNGEILDPEAVADGMSGGFWSGLFCWLCAFIVLILSWAVKIMAWGLILFRMIQVYLYLAISPLPLSTFPSNELSQVGKSFLKSFVAVCLQGALIYLVVQLSPAIIGTIFETPEAVPLADTTFGMLGVAALYSIAILMTLFGTQQMSRRLCGAM